jgi:hypothetical protein
VSPEDLTEALEIVGWSGRKLAAKASCAPNTIVQMQHGERRIPEEIADYLQGLVAWHQANPFPSPEEWRRRLELMPKKKRKARRRTKLG